MKRILVLMLAGLFMMNAVSFAAVGGSKVKSSGSSISSTQKSSSSSSVKDDYKPSASANSYKDKAPDATAKSNTNSGMLGGLLSNMFGLGGSGFFDLFFGVLANVVLFGGMIMLISFIWRKIKEKRNK